MCGIVGVVGAQDNVMVAEVEEMTERLRHRGPDANGTRSFERCSLGHTRLRIIDLSPLGDQPLSNEDDTAWVAFNGEIYNFAELRSVLQAGGHRFRSTSDTEVLVHLYEEHGDDMARHLRGMFAFAIWDERRRRLFLARDRLGQKPLYYRIEGDRLSFASEVQALTRPGDSIDPGAINSYLRLGWVPGPGTIRSGITELLAGHVLVWEAGHTRLVRYWSLPVVSFDAEAPAPGELSDVLMDALRRHLVADVSVGLFLSAGVDSAVIARLACEVGARLRTYTVGFDSETDESTEAATMARRLGLEHTVVPVRVDEAIASVGRFVQDMDQPTVDGMNSWLISRAVRDAGSVVALSGLGGDELFGGYSTFRHVPHLVRAGRAVRGVPALPRSVLRAMGWSRRLAHARERRALNAIVGGGWGTAYQAVRGLFGASELAEIWPPSRHFADGPIRAWRLPGQPARALVGELEMTNYLPFQLLRDTDCMSMAHGLEVRVPLLDDNVVDVALRGQGSSSKRWDKSNLVAAVDSDLDRLVTRAKRTFTLPIDDWMKGRLRERVEGAIVTLGDEGLGFSRLGLEDLWRGYLAGQAGWRPVWALAVLGMWVETSRAPS